MISIRKRGVGLLFFVLLSCAMQDKKVNLSDFACSVDENRPDGYVLPENMTYEELNGRDTWVALMYKGFQMAGYAVYEYPYLEKRSVYPPEILTNNACLKRIFIAHTFCNSFGEELHAWFRSFVIQQMRDRGCKEIVIREL